jgi:pimeloyl-ACP methyl ester carboxylesterase
MTMNRRDAIFSAGALAFSGATLEASAADGARDTEYPEKKAFLFVHGAWHCSIHWARVVERLVAEGHSAVAVDLPGSGLKAPVPHSYFTNDWSAFLTEPSATKDIGLDDYVGAVVPVLEGLAKAHAKVVLVGHSFGGQTITLAAERVPHLVQHLVYVTAFCPTLQTSGSADAYDSLPENERSAIVPVMLGDPEVIGAYRLNPRSPDPAYLEKARQAFYGDLPMDEFLKFAAYLNPDAPAKAAADDGRGTVARWGRIPRTFIRCTLDQAIPIELQDRMIRDADQFTPQNRFVVETLVSSHSPFASMPDRLSAILAKL